MRVNRDSLILKALAVNDEKGAIPVFQIDPIAQHLPIFFCIDFDIDFMRLSSVIVTPSRKVVFMLKLGAKYKQVEILDYRTAFE